MSHDRREGSGIVPEGGWQEARYRAEKKREAVVQPAEGGSEGGAGAAQTTEGWDGGWRLRVHFVGLW